MCIRDRYGVSWDQSVYYLKLTFLFVGSIILISALMFALFSALKKIKKNLGG